MINCYLCYVQNPLKLKEFVMYEKCGYSWLEGLAVSIKVISCRTKVRTILRALFSFSSLAAYET